MLVLSTLSRPLVDRDIQGLTRKSYRLGVLGFLTSAELRAEGYESNSGLRDQMTALRWVKKNIGGFGGDGENVTVIGESAGSGESFSNIYLSSVI